MMDGSELDGRIKNFDRFALVLDQGGIGSHDLQARDRRDQDAKVGLQLLLASCRMAPPFPRAIVIVMDSVGIGELPDASSYGDQGSNTLGNIARRSAAARPDAAIARTGSPRSARWRAAVAAAGRRRPDGRSVRRQGLGHRPLGDDGHRARPRLPDVSERFPRQSSSEFSRRTGRGVIGNKAASGTADHRRARCRAHADRRADRLHVGRQRLSDRRARGRSCRFPSSIAPAKSPTSSSAKGSASVA